MLFTRPSKERIRQGEQTLTFRRWKRPQARAGGLYKLPPTGAIRVASVEVVETGDITDEEARQAGHADRTETLAMLGDGNEPIHRIAFAYVPPEQVPRAAPLAAAEIVERPRSTDRRSKHPWTLAALALIAQHPERRAADLAATIGFQTAPFKANVRRLKALGLTESLEVGYRLTRLGREVLERLQRPLRRGGV